MGDVVERDRDRARRGRSAGRDLVGHRRGASTALRRLARRTREGVGATARPCARRDPDDEAARPLQRSRARRRSAGRTRSRRRVSAARMGERRMVELSRAARALGGARHDGRASPAGPPRRARRSTARGGDRASGVGGRAAVRRARSTASRSTESRQRRSSPRSSVRARARRPRRPNSARDATPRCSATRRRVPTATCGAPVR